MGRSALCFEKVESAAIKLYTGDPLARLDSVRKTAGDRFEISWDATACTDS
jgi:hypothetical protein